MICAVSFRFAIQLKLLATHGFDSLFAYQTCLLAHHLIPQALPSHGG